MNASVPTLRGLLLHQGYLSAQVPRGFADERWAPVLADARIPQGLEWLSPPQLQRVAATIRRAGAERVRVYVSRWLREPNPRRAWQELPPSTPYLCNAPAVGKTILRGGVPWLVQACATPSKKRPGRRQFWIVSTVARRPCGMAVDRRNVTRSLFRRSKRSERMGVEEVFARIRPDLERFPAHFDPAVIEAEGAAAEQARAERWRRREERRIARETGTLPFGGRGGETGVDAMMGLWRSLHSGAPEVFSWLALAQSEGFVEGLQLPADPGSSDVLDDLFQAIRDAPWSRGRKAKAFSDVRRKHPMMATEHLRAWVLGNAPSKTPNPSRRRRGRRS